MTATRINPLGITFTIVQSGNKVSVNARNKSILVDMPYHEFMQCWYNWQMKGEFIQNAFPKLPAEEREFLMTTITPEEWKEIFEGKQHVKD